ncbi:hypothetical protein NDU88_001760 [Pleurodeles waltl]|uniref:Uncharacterized protein n=1 Tax=Pleurodeles waltl TaxID=8319 RepID=A0AAV7TJ87_PLEWA|nr:hypothetical protein NDU88_001760 [Pleurodeles waltl]
MLPVPSTDQGWLLLAAFFCFVAKFKDGTTEIIVRAGDPGDVTSLEAQMSGLPDKSMSIEGDSEVTVGVGLQEFAITGASWKGPFALSLLFDPRPMAVVSSESE